MSAGVGWDGSSSTWNDLGGNNQNQVICVFDEHNDNFDSDESEDYAVFDDYGTTMGLWDDETGCPMVWERWSISGDGWCLIYFGTHLISNAESVCHEEGLKLPLPAGQELNTDYNMAFTSMLWGLFHETKVAIGANDVDVEGEWRNRDGDELWYDNWAPGEPNDFGEGEDYAVMIVGDMEEYSTRIHSTWNDVGDQEGVAVICEIYSNVHHDHDDDHHDEHEWDYHDEDELHPDEIRTLIIIVCSIVSAIVVACCCCCFCCWCASKKETNQNQSQNVMVNMYPQQ
jgi:hypothetical protein